MTKKDRVIATESFMTTVTEESSGKHPGVVGGAVLQGTELWSDDPIVIARPEKFVDADIVPGPRVATAPPDPMADLWANPRWIEIARAFQALATDEDAEPSQVHVAEKPGFARRRFANFSADSKYRIGATFRGSSATTQAGTSGRVCR
jgi:hypothetical protein